MPLDQTLFESISMKILRKICNKTTNLSSYQQSSRNEMKKWLLEEPELSIQEFNSAMQIIAESGQTKYSKRPQGEGVSKKRGPRPSGEQGRATAKRHQTMQLGEEGHGITGIMGERIHHAPDEEILPDFHEVSDARIESIIESDFLKAPSKELLDERASRFIAATGNTAVSQVVCASCARRRFTRQCTTRKLRDIPNQEQLVPLSPHPAQVLFQGKLLYAGNLDNDEQEVNICHECMLYLKRNRRPKFSLANDLWIGEIPSQLQQMTLPERILISKYFCAAYIFKLYPKQKGAKYWGKADQMHNALRGNVSTYKLDPSQVARMVEGNIYPPNVKILSATIGVTFVGPKGISEKYMPKMFRVSRKKVRSALHWLKDNNPIYADIIISEDNLSLLPEDDIPDEIMATTKISDDVERVQREHAGYVPDQDEEEPDDVDQMRRTMEMAGLTEMDDEVEAEAGETKGKLSIENGKAN